MRTWWSRLALASVGIAIGAALLVASFRGIDLERVGHLLVAGHWGWPAALALTATAAFVLAKTARWQVLLGEGGRIPLGSLARPVLAGLALNSLIPHSGELLRAVSVERSHGRPAVTVLASIFVERLFDLFAVLLLGAVALWSAPAAQPDLARAFELIGVLAAIGAIGVLAALAAPDAVRRLALVVSQRLPARWRSRVAELGDEVVLGLAGVRRPGTVLAVLLWSLLQWAAIAVCVVGCAAVVGFGMTTGAALLVVVGVVVAFLLPNAPGYAGAAQAAFVVALRPFGIGAEWALGASVVYQLLMVLPIAVVGLACVRGAWRPISAA